MLRTPTVVLASTLVLFFPSVVTAQQGRNSAAVKVSPVVPFIEATARAKGVNPDFMLAMGEVESGLRANAVGRAGERGPLQVLPRTFRALGGKNLNDWRETTRVGIRYFTKCLRAAKGDYSLAAIYYNAGIGNINRRAVWYASKVSRHYRQRLNRRSLLLIERRKHSPNRVFYAQSL